VGIFQRLNDTFVRRQHKNQNNMAILISTSIQGQTAEGYDQVSVYLHQAIRKSPGFILHSAYAADGAWHVMEVWNSKAEADEFFAKMVRPNLPKEIHPKRSYQELHSVVTSSLETSVRS
jgi:hypothetical protein